MAMRPPGLLDRLAAVWFPLLLGGLLLVALPGLILFVLTLFGAQAPVNAWLQENLSITYQLPFDWWLGVPLLLVPPGIVVLYFLKLRRRPLQVPSTFLWKKSIEDLHVNSLFQWLRQNVLLLLQVLAALFLLYTVLGFRLHGATRQGQHYVLMVDNSASMTATDVAPSRLEQARQEAIRTIDSYTDSDVGMVIVFNSSAEILQSYTSDRGLLRAAVNRIQPTRRPTRIDEALQFAACLANPTRSTENEASRPADEVPGKERTYVPTEGVPTLVHLFSDGRFPDVPDFALGNLSIQYTGIGESSADGPRNVAITTLNALRDEEDPGRLQGFVRLLNFNTRPVRATVQLEVSVDGQVRGLYEKDVTLPANQDDTAVPGDGSLTFDLRDIDDRATAVLHAKLVARFVGETAAVRDPFALDDEAWLVAGVVRRARILVVSPGNRVLEAFFNHSATRDVAVTTFASPEDLDKDDVYRTPARNGSYDLVVFDRCAPAREEDMPLGNTFFIDSVPPPWKRADMPKLEAPVVRGWLSQHPLLRYLTGLYDIGISEGFRFDLSDPRVPPRTPRLLESRDDTAVLFALNRRSFTDLVMTFALINDRGEWLSNWPLQPSFPLFMRNVVYTLGNVSDAAGEENVLPGQPKTLRPEAAVSQIEVIDPVGNRETLQRGSRADFTFGKTDELGVYQVRWDGATQRSFEVNLFDPSESDLKPRGQIRIGLETLAAGEERGVPRELWKWLALGAFLLLLLEWYIYNRRVYV